MVCKAGKIKGGVEVGGFTVGAHNIDEVIRGICRKEVEPEYLVIDLFCGAGGTSTGFEMTGGKHMVIACVNHDYMAIKSHWVNYPHIAHFEEDIRTLDLRPLVKLLAHYMALYPGAKVILWASLECTNFSKAKGGQARDADSRTLADHLERYISALRPDYVQIENVVEFMSWGPLDDNGKPISKKNGADFLRWKNEIDALGYYNEWCTLNSADFGAYTSRERLFGCFARLELPIKWPVATHEKMTDKRKKARLQERLFNAYGLKHPWKACKEVLDFSDEGVSIFLRDKPLVDNTLERIYAGLVKFVAGGKEAFLVKYNSMGSNGRYNAPSMDEPCPVIAAQSRIATAFISKYYSGKPDGKNIPVSGPAGTITTVDSQSLVFIQSYYGNGNCASVEAPCPTITTKDRAAVCFIDRQFGNGGNSGVDEPVGALLANPKTHLVTAERAFIMPTNYTNQPTSLDVPLPTITANRKWQYLINPSWYGNLGSVDQPCPVIVARQDKAPLYVVNAETGTVGIRVDESDSEVMRRIKEFMAMYNIIDIKMRMLKIGELLKIQGFPADYKLEGSQERQKKFIGNSVVPEVVRAWACAM